MYTFLPQHSLVPGKSKIGLNAPCDPSSNSVSAWIVAYSKISGLNVCMLLYASALLFPQIQLQVCCLRLLPRSLHSPFHYTYYMSYELRHKTPSLWCICRKMFHTVGKCCKLTNFNRNFCTLLIVHTTIRTL